MFSIEIHDGAASLVLAGDIDLQTTADLKNEIQQLAGISVLEIKAGSVRYIDSSGIAVLLMARQHCLDQGIELRMPVISAAVFRVLEIARLDQLLPIGNVVSVEDATTENFGVSTLDEPLESEEVQPVPEAQDDQAHDTETETDAADAPDINPGTFR